MSPLIDVAKRLERDQTGASLAEYGLLIALIAMVCLAGMTILGGQLSNLLRTIYSTV
jgi:pilus assembly protein Flp/PilA